jgi:hypothetical protein
VTWTYKRRQKAHRVLRHPRCSSRRGRLRSCRAQTVPSRQCRPRIRPSLHCPRRSSSLRLRRAPEGAVGTGRRASLVVREVRHSISRVLGVLPRGHWARRSGSPSAPSPEWWGTEEATQIWLWQQSNSSGANDLSQTRLIAPEHCLKAGAASFWMDSSLGGAAG